MGKAKDSFIVYYDWEEALSDLSNEQLGELLRAVFAYEKRGEVYAGTDSAVKMAMRFVRGALDRNRERYAETCARNRQNAEKRWGRTKSRADTSNATACDRMRPCAIDADHEPEPEHEHDPERDREQEQEQDASGGGSGLLFASELELVVKKLTGAGIPVDEGAERALEEWIQEYGSVFVEKAVCEAIQRKARKFGYLEGIVRNWVREGITSGEKVEAYQRKKTPKAPAPCPVQAPQSAGDLEREAAESAARAAQIQRLLMAYTGQDGA